MEDYWMEIWYDCRCNYLFSYLNLNLTLDPGAYGMVFGYAKIQYIDSGALPWEEGSLTGSLYLYLANVGNLTSNFSIYPNGCNGQDEPHVVGGPLSGLIAAGTFGQFLFPIGNWFSCFLWPKFFIDFNCFSTLVCLQDAGRLPFTVLYLGIIETFKNDFIGVFNTNVFQVYAKTSINI